MRNNTRHSVNAVSLARLAGRLEREDLALLLADMGYDDSVVDEEFDFVSVALCALDFQIL